MSSEVKWIKIKVGLFEGTSFKRIKKAKIGGESFRDKLTAVWFELLDLGAKCNNNGLLYSDEIPYGSEEDIAIMIDREVDEVKLCLEFYRANGMIEIIDNFYCLSNWTKYQNLEGLEKIREQNRIRQKRWYDNHKKIELEQHNVSQTLKPNENALISNSNILNSNNNINNINNNSSSSNYNINNNKFVKPTLEEVEAYCRERNNNINAEQFIAFYDSNGWKVGKNPMKSWKSAIITWEGRNKDKQKQSQSTFNKVYKKEDYEGCDF